MQIKNEFQLKYLAYFLDSINIFDIIQEKTPLQTLKKIAIDDFSDLKSIKVVCQELNRFQSRNDIQKEIIELENELNKKILEFYNLTDKEIEYIENSFL